MVTQKSLFEKNNFYLQSIEGYYIQLLFQLAKWVKYSPMVRKTTVQS